MNRDVIITCAVTGAADTVGKHPAIPVTPKQIAEACISAAEAGAAIVHIHVREVKTGKGGRDPSRFREVVKHIRDSGTDVVLNLTAGMGAQLQLSDSDPRVTGAETDLVSVQERFIHVEELVPEICSIDCGSMNFGEDLVVVNRPDDLRWMAKRAQELGVKPELEIFDMGQMQHALMLLNEGLVDSPPLFQFCLGIPSGAPATAEAVIALKSMLPRNANWAAFGISRAEMPMVAQAMLLGGNVRVGLEDNLYLRKGIFASNAQLVEKAVKIITELGGRALSPSEARERLVVERRW